MSNKNGNATKKPVDTDVIPLEEEDQKELAALLDARGQLQEQIVVVDKRVEELREARRNLLGKHNENNDQIKDFYAQLRRIYRLGKRDEFSYDHATGALIRHPRKEG